MTTTITTTQGQQVPIYRNVGNIIIGTDSDFTDAIELNEPSFLRALETLGYAVIPMEATA